MSQDHTEFDWRATSSGFTVTLCRFFSTHAWDADRLGLALARLIVTRLLDHDVPIEVVVDDTLFRRWGRRVFGSFWTHDGSAQDPNALGRGNWWVVAGIVVDVQLAVPAQDRHQLAQYRG